MENRTKKESKKIKRLSDFESEINLAEAIETASREVKNMSQDTDPEERSRADAHLKTLVDCEERITKARKEHRRSIVFKVLCFGLSALLMILGFIIPGAGGKLTEIGRRFMDKKDG